MQKGKMVVEMKILTEATLNLIEGKIEEKVLLLVESART